MYRESSNNQMSIPSSATVYDRLREHLSAADLLQRLGVEILRESGSEAHCKPLCHDSSSGDSLHVNLHTGRWTCRACQSNGVYGDLIQLVEYVRTGGAAPAHGIGQRSSESHREAVRWLCEQYAIPYESGGHYDDPSLDLVHAFAMQAHQHLLGDATLLDWIQTQWGFDRGTVEAYGIGYMPSPLLPSIAAESERPDARGAFRSSGLGFYPPSGTFTTRFEGRVLFPYLENGRAVYIIGRSTPWTPKRDDDGAVPKYYKLPVHSEERSYISQRITNNHLYNEPALKGATTILVLEGVADCVAGSSLGIKCVSPVTISFNAKDIERFVKKCHEQGVARVELLFDNEISGAGASGATRTGRKLVEHGLCVSILALPLGARQRAARDEIRKALGDDKYAEMEASEPKRRKEIIAECVIDPAQREWIKAQISAAKIDMAEWVAMEGAGAAGRFDQIRKEGQDVVGLLIEAATKLVDESADVFARIALFSDAITLAAHVDERMVRDDYASLIAKAAGKSVTKSAIAQKIAQARKVTVTPKRAVKQDAEDKAQKVSTASLVLLPPQTQSNAVPLPPPPMAAQSSATGNPKLAVPPPPNASSEPVSEHDRYAPVRESVMRAVEEKLAEEAIGKHVAQTITLSMGYTPFRTPDDLYLVRGNERIAVGLGRSSPRFLALIYLAAALTNQKSSHKAYIAATVYFLEHMSKRAHDVSWSHVGEDGSVYFPTGDAIGRIIRIGVKSSPDGIERTRMNDVRVPAVAGSDFRPFNYINEPGAIDAVLDLFRWTSLSEGDRLVLIFWIVCLPILRRIGTVPIVRIEGGSSSGKTRTVDAVSFLVNGGKSSSVPTSAALISRLSTEMLTIDDNRESGDVDSAFRGTLLQATNLGAREKRRVNTDTGTVVERVCGALLMNGIEPIHDGKSELTSRMLTLRCERMHRAPDSPVADAALGKKVLEMRDGFWSEAVRRCAIALQLDEEHGEALGSEIEELFGNTRIGRLSAYVRLMYLCWVAGLTGNAQAAALEHIDPRWQRALLSLSSGSLQSLVSEEFSVAAVRYAFAWGAANAKASHSAATESSAFDGQYLEVLATGEAYLGPIGTAQLARMIRSAGKEMNAPRSIAGDLRAGQLEARLVDGLGFLTAAGFETEVQTTRAGKRRFTFRRAGRDGAEDQQQPGAAPDAQQAEAPTPQADTWSGP